MRITAADVAMIAGVRRPVVTMWQKRYSGIEAFPAPDDGLFDSDAVVGWLEAHGRGNNPHPRRALPMLRMVLEARADAGRADRLSAVLAFRAAYGESLVSDVASSGLGSVGRAAETLDRLDCFGSEVLSLGSDFGETVAAVDLFLDERFGAADAMRWITDDCLVRHVPPFAAAALSPAAADLLARVAVALAESTANPGLLDAAGTGFPWLGRIPPEWPHPVGIVRDDSPVGRHTRRVVGVAEWDARVVSGEAEWAVAVATVLDAEPADTFARAALGDDAQVRLVLGPARLLAEPAGDQAARDELLRDGVVRAVVKLPTGCRPAHPREALALWVVAERDSLPFEQHRTFVADLMGVELTGQVVGDLAMDLTVAAGHLDGQRQRAWRTLRPVLTRHLIARGGSLVTVPTLSSDKSTAPLTVEELRASAMAAGLSEGPPMRVGKASVRREVTAQGGIDDGWLKLLPGTRLRLERLGPGDLPVWTADDGSPRLATTVDRLTGLAWSRAWLTKPGDVILGPGPTATIDLAGGALVAAPARALRLADHAPVTPQQLRRAIAGAPRGTKAPQWRLAPLERGQRLALSEAADKIDQRRAELRAQLDALDVFEDSLLDACETTTITLETC